MWKSLKILENSLKSFKTPEIARDRLKSSKSP